MSQLAEIEVTFPGGRQVDARVGRHVIRTDQPVEKGGADGAPSPFELFLASIGTCAGIFVQGFCAARGLSMEGVKVVEHIASDEAGALAGIDLELVLPSSFPERYRPAIARVVEQCSVKKAIATQPPISVRMTLAE